jgi:tRNA nucleotidyltransferase (CCA-adding enzyme)
MKLNDDIKWLFNHFEEHGYKLYLIGGAVRNHLLNIPYTDYDFTTTAKPDEIIALLGGHKLDCFQKEIGSIKLYLNNNVYEITTMREEFGVQNLRYPLSIKFVDDLKKDVERRDFTINALAYHPNQGIVDYLGGINDLNNRIIKFIKDPNISIVLDPIRLIRALRFSLTLGFDIDENDYRVMVKECKRVSELGKIRFDELERICNIDGVKNHLLKHYNIYLAAYPELKNILLKALNSDFDIRNLKYLLFDKQELNCLSKEDTKIQEGINEVINSRTDLYNTKLLYIKYNDKLDIIFDVLELMDKDVSLLKYNLELIRNNNFCLKIKDLSVSYKDLEELGVPQNKYSIYLNELLDIVLKDDKLNNRKILLNILKNKV